MSTPIMNATLTGTDAIYLALDKFKVEISKEAVGVVSDVASEARKIAYTTFFNKTKQSGGLLYNSMYWRTKMHKPPLSHSSSTGYFDRRGEERRLVHFSLSAKGPYSKSSHLSSYPMNLWERNSKNGPGLWIMTVKLAPMVAASLGKTIANAEDTLSMKGQALIDGGIV